MIINKYNNDFLDELDSKIEYFLFNSLNSLYRDDLEDIQSFEFEISKRITSTDRNNISLFVEEIVETIYIVLKEKLIELDDICGYDFEIIVNNEISGDLMKIYSTVEYGKRR